MCFGPCKRLCHWGPLMALGIIKVISWSMVHCSKMILPPSKSFLGFLNLCVFLMLAGLTMYNHLSGMFEGPGYLPYKWCPEYASDEAYLQFCKVCQGFKAPRSHHCRKCGRCVLKMDHHCPWINNCVGHANHFHFTSFLLFSVLGSLQAALVIGYTLYRAFHRAWYLLQGYSDLERIQFSVLTLALSVFALGLAIGVTLSVGALFYFQLRAILRNRTGIEDWIVEKALFRREATDPPFVYPYDLGWKENLTQVINLNLEPKGDGISWPVVKGCSQYTLTMEQKEQKDEKRARTRSYVCTRRYGGSWLPVTSGIGTLCHPPCTDESRLPLEPGQKINVTRWRRYWLFGEKLGDNATELTGTVGNSGGERRRGWFPRCCAVDLGEEALLSEDKKLQ